MADTQDPWAPIRQLKFVDRGQSVTGSGSENGQDAVTSYVASWDLDGETGWDNLKEAGFETKYSSIIELEPGKFVVRLQQPGKHKYDTMDVMYELDPETGVAEMVGEPIPTRETSSKDKWQDRIEKSAILAAAIAGGGYALQAGAAAAGAGGAGTAGTAGGTAGANWGAIGTSAAKSAAMNAGMTLAQGGNLKDALKSGAIGGLTAGVGGYASGALNLSPTLTGAVTGGLGAGLRGGDAGDILTGAGIGALSSYTKANGITGNAMADNAILKGGVTALKGGGTNDILASAAGGAVGAFGQQDRTTAVDPYGPGSGWGNDTLTSMGAGDNTVNDADPYGLDYSGLDAGGTGNYNEYYGNEGNAYKGDDALDASTNSPVNSGEDAWDWSGGFGAAGDWLKSFFVTNTSGATTGGTGGFDSRWLSQILGLVGAGVNQMNIEKMAQDNRDWQDKTASDRRRRQMPGALPAMKTTVMRGGTA